MQRIIFNYLKDWLMSRNRKPLVIRGARQVGKTWIVRYFAEKLGKNLIELNFERQPSNIELFASNDPQIILTNLSALTNQKIEPQESLLFLDEIQAAPQLLAKLRWFAEDLPELPVVSAGSLLDFILADHEFSIPVGRISYAYIEPLSFEEFLMAKNQTGLLNVLKNFDFSSVIPSPIHHKLLDIFKEYILVGGLPAAASAWIYDNSFIEVNKIQNDLLANYRDDFNKYKRRIGVERLEEVMAAVPKMLSQKFIYSRVNSTTSSSTMKEVLYLLEKARIIYKVKSSAANGVPLAAEIKEKYFKETFLDVGLCSALLGLNLSQINSMKEINLINKGGIAEQIVGQILRTLNPPYQEPALYCWHREEPGASAEIDYLIQHQSEVIPIEIKSGTTRS